MNKFKIGDRVAVYGSTERTSSDSQNGNPLAYRRGEKGTVATVVDIDEITVDLDKGGWVVVHPKQCRKLVPTPFKVGDRVTLNKDGIEWHRTHLTEIYHVQDPRGYPKKFMAEILAFALADVEPLEIEITEIGTDGDYFVTVNSKFGSFKCVLDHGSLMKVRK